MNKWLWRSVKFGLLSGTALWPSTGLAQIANLASHFVCDITSIGAIPNDARLNDAAIAAAVNKSAARAWAVGG